MKISTSEQKAIKVVCEMGAKWGYGNMISHLQSAWALSLIHKHGMPIDHAIEATEGRSPYPFDKHLSAINEGEI